MKIIYQEWEQAVLLRENKVNCIYLEDTRYFRRILTELYQQIQGGEGGFILSEEGKSIAIKKQVEMIFSPFLLNLEDRRFYTNIYKQLQDYSIGEEMYSETCEMKNSIQKYMVKLLEFVPYSIKIENEVDFVAFLKSTGIKIEYEVSTIEEQLIEYMELVTEILKKNIFVLVGMKNYFTVDEIKKIYETLLPQKIFLIDIERQKWGFHFPCECDIIIDTDLCEL